MSIPATQMRPGMIIKFKDDLHLVFSIEHRTPGNLRAFIQAKLRNVRTGASFTERFRSPDPIERVYVDEIKMEFLYNDGDEYYFMDDKYEQTMLTRETLGDAVEFLTPNLGIAVSFHDGKAVGIELPTAVVMTVMETEPGHQVRHCKLRHQAQRKPKPASIRPGPSLHQRRRQKRSASTPPRRLHEPRLAWLIPAHADTI